MAHGAVAADDRAAEILTRHVLRDVVPLADRIANARKDEADEEQREGSANDRDVAWPVPCMIIEGVLLCACCPL